MNNREIFEVVEIEVIAFEAEDIIRTSTGEGGNMPGELGHLLSLSENEE